MNRVVIPAKAANAKQDVIFDFISILAEGETLAAAVVSASVFSGTDASPESLLNGSASIDGTRVTQNIQGGQTGVIYTLLCIVGTCNSQHISLAGYLSILPDTDE